MKKKVYRLQKGAGSLQGCYRRLTVRNSGAVGGLHDVGTPPGLPGLQAGCA
jgi:hypothetical protein